VEGGCRGRVSSRSRCRGRGRRVRLGCGGSVLVREFGCFGGMGFRLWGEGIVVRGGGTR
jgi:hypothetical protein